jgi:hypothetical protein
MKNTNQVNPNLETIASIIEKVHRCADCPIRALAVKRPQSVFARLHTWHKAWWPGWKAHQAKACPYSEMAKTQA